jgi:hypothetical protein
LTASRPEPDWQLSAEHNGYSRRFGVVHQRQLERQADEILIRDRLVGGGHNADIVFQLADDLEANRNGDMVTIERDGRVLMRIGFPSETVSIRRGGDTPGQGGWVSRRFGIREPADRIVWSGAVDGEGVVTRLILSPAVLT